MEVILTQNLSNLGTKFSLVKVKPGYYRNYLFPKGLAMIATPKLMKHYEKLREKIVVTERLKKEKAEEIKKKLEGIVLHFQRKATGKNKLYGSIGEKEIIAEIKKQAELELEKENIKMKEHIKSLGEFNVTIELDQQREISAVVKVKVEAISQ
ncbi:50S ribosomal protein L9 [Candidatus Peregrinibacteria bacterium]|nr:50S ribosomal protein L9 [Candidatus Peregrinibacteria bacterium]